VRFAVYDPYYGPHCIDFEGNELLSFAAITDDRPAEFAAAEHDRCIIPIKPGNIAAWLNPGDPLGGAILSTGNLLLLGIPSMMGDFTEQEGARAQGRVTSGVQRRATPATLSFAGSV